jgi:hypothetical protein
MDNSDDIWTNYPLFQITLDLHLQTTLKIV